MKKIASLLFFVLSASTFAQTYQYKPFPESDANWKWRVFTEFMVPIGWQNEIYTEVSDTMIGSSGSYFEKNKKVYYQFKDSANFELIYDFNITIGDTFFAKGYSNIQDSFDYVLMDDSSGTDPTFPNRRILQFNSGVRWVEGIGNVISSYAMPFSLNHTPTPQRTSCT
jgi:hypothetical protein